MSYYLLEERIKALEERVEKAERERQLREAYDVLKNKENLTDADRIVLKCYEDQHTHINMELWEAMSILFNATGVDVQARNFKEEFKEYWDLFFRFLNIEERFSRIKTEDMLKRKVYKPIETFEDFRKMILGE